MSTEPGVNSGYAMGPAAVVGGRPTRPRKRTNHMFAGPDYSIIHPGIFPHNARAARLAEIRDWLVFDVEALMAGNIYNEGEYGAKSTFTAILGREACYSGKVIKWDELLAKGRDLAPGIDEYTMSSTPPTAPGNDGRYPVPIPGRYNPFAQG